MMSKLSEAQVEMEKVSKTAKSNVLDTMDALSGLSSTQAEHKASLRKAIKDVKDRIACLDRANDFKEDTSGNPLTNDAAKSMLHDSAVTLTALYEAASVCKAHLKDKKK